jgi:hypothetical protein
MNERIMVVAILLVGGFLLFVAFAFGTATVGGLP